MKPLVPVGNDEAGLTYQCQLEWPEDAVVRFSWRNPTGLECFAYNTDDPEEEPHEDHTPRCSGMAHFPVPAHIPAASNYFNGEIKRGRWNVLGGDKLSWETTEKFMWDRMNEGLNCSHDFHNVTWNLSGDATCSKCHMFVHGMFMDKGLQNCRLLAYQAHDGVKRKYNGADYIVHPQSVYERINWWRRVSALTGGGVTCQWISGCAWQKQPGFMMFLKTARIFRMKQ